ncbi:MAG: YIP1 family protein [Patescibacteria group bacterium]|nr:YIP1 family protein [Patescibacteria group bacterium]
MVDVQNSKKSSLLSYFLNIIIRPTSGIRKIVQEKPSFKQIIIFLFIIGLLRGIIEGIWMLLWAGQFSQVISSLILLKSYLKLGIPFIISSISNGYVRWVGFALVACFLGRFFDKKGEFKDFLRVSGIILGVYLLTILPNFLYFFWDKLPMIQYKVSEVYNPAQGIGQILVSFWIVFIFYKVARVISELPKFQAFLVGLSVQFLNLGALIFGSFFFFNLPHLVSLPFKESLSLATYVFIIITLLLIPIFFWLGFKLERWKKIKEKEKFE